MSVKIENLSVLGITREDFEYWSKNPQHLYEKMTGEETAKFWDSIEPKENGSMIQRMKFLKDNIDKVVFKNER